MRQCVGAAAGTSGDLSTDRKSTRLNSSHRTISYAVFCLKKKKQFSQIRGERIVICFHEQGTLFQRSTTVRFLWFYQPLQREPQHIQHQSIPAATDLWSTA